MNQAPQTIDPAKPEATSASPNLWMILVGVFIAWLATLSIAYAASFQTLAGGIFLVFLLGFPASTFLFFCGRNVVTKRIVKALDYLTILTFLTGLLAISEIDAQTLKGRAEQAAGQINRIQQDLQERVSSRLRKCDDIQIKPQPDSNIFSGDFIRSFLLCYELSDWRGVELNQLSDKQIASRSGLLHVTFTYSRDKETRELISALEDYDHARYEMKGEGPFSFSLPRRIAYLLVAFAFAVRLTRTTLEVFEWHT